jgi:spoIIIJ-associated protein
VEWVEITGKSIEEATARALEQLGVAEADAEVQIVDQPKAGLFGRVRGEARVRARVRPVEPRPKRSRGSSSKGRGERSGQRGGRGPRGEGEQRAEGQGRRSGAKSSKAAGAAKSNKVPAGGTTTEVEEETMAEGVTLQEQAEVAREFLEGLVSTMGLSATVEIRELDDETVELAVDGDDLGMLVGPKGSTLAAVQDITRTVVQGRFTARTDRILVDIARYRERRAAALTRFTAQVAAEVLESGEERALEPMSPADRKVVHDAVNEIEGVVTRSEGEEPERYVVLAVQAD